MVIPLSIPEEDRSPVPLAWPINNPAWWRSMSCHVQAMKGPLCVRTPNIRGFPVKGTWNRCGLLKATLRFLYSQHNCRTSAPCRGLASWKAPAKELECVKFLHSSRHGDISEICVLTCALAHTRSLALLPLFCCSDQCFCSAPGRKSRETDMLS